MSTKISVKHGMSTLAPTSFAFVLTLFFLLFSDIRRLDFVPIIRCYLLLRGICYVRRRRNGHSHEPGFTEHHLKQAFPAIPTYPRTYMIHSPTIFNSNYTIAKSCNTSCTDHLIDHRFRIRSRCTTRPTPSIHFS